MPVSVGDKLGPYEILAPIGAGGMGEVWKARDTRLNREVAIKFSQAEFSDRFQREANAIASLNHPNICTLHDVGPNYLVMELIEGPTLADRIKEGPVPLDEALAIAQQIADALGAAHDKNIVHRDLKPGNIKLRSDGSVKVLDFGLAKSGAAEAEITHDSPTLMQSPTLVGVILGTAPYMAPEQARGKAVDERADIWAFGVVLYEMLTGKRLFEGEDLTDTLASVVKVEPNLAPVPAKVRRLLERCLQKDPKKRLRDIGDYGLLLQDQSAGETAPSQHLGWTPWSIAAVLLAGLSVLAVVHFRERPPSVHVINSTLLPPNGTQFNFGGGIGLPALSPDGSRIVFGAVAKDNLRLLYVRRLDSSTAQLLEGAQDAAFPFWSPDSRWVAFEQQGTLKKIDTQGGPPVTLAKLPSGIRGGSWSPAGVILVGSGGAILRISVAGGALTEIVPGANGGDTYPWFLPDGRHFLYGYRQAGDIPLHVASIDEPGKPGKVVAQVHSNAVYAQGHLLYLRERTLMAQPFETQRFETSGEAVPIAEGIPTFQSPSRAAGFTVSAGGLLVYTSSATSGIARLVWKDRQGNTAGTLGEIKGGMAEPALSRDGKHLAFPMQDTTSNNAAGNLWIFDMERGIPTRFTFDQGADRNPVWSPDGSTIYFDSARNGNRNLYRKASNGSASEEVVMSNGGLKRADDISPDGQLLMYEDTGRSASPKADIWVTPIVTAKAGEKSEPRVFLSANFPVLSGVFRPDGHWVAYLSGDELGNKTELYIAPFPGPGGKRQVSSGGARFPQWRRDGKELFYQSDSNELMAAEVIDKNGVLEIGKTQNLFGGLNRSPRSWTVSADGQKFVVYERAGSDATQPLTLVQNWTAGIRK
jgi:serine/threonine protein kinase